MQIVIVVMHALFLSTLSLRRATQPDKSHKPTEQISIHALLAESDPVTMHTWRKVDPFLSTLSLRRATRLWTILYSCPGNFYPRSPCGERPVTRVASTPTTVISIHALLAESDPPHLKKTLHAAYFYPRSPCGERRQQHLPDSTHRRISIHALLAESDIDDLIS